MLQSHHWLTSFPEPACWLLFDKIFFHLQLTTAFDQVWKATRQQHGIEICPAPTGVSVYVCKDSKLDGHLRKAESVVKAHMDSKPL